MSLISNWTVTGATDISSQTVSYFANNACSGAVVETEVVAGNTTNTDPFTGVDANFYHYFVTATDDAGNESLPSACSPALLIDTTSPAQAMSLGWNQTTPTNVASASINSSWAISGDGFVSDQEIEYYTGAACDTLAVAYTSIGTGANTHQIDTLLTLVTNTTYTYRIRTTDTASNQSVSLCSAPLTYDISDPLAVTTPSLNWTEASPHNTASINANWAVSLTPAAEILSQSIQYYSTADCSTTAEEGPFPLSSTDITHNLTGLTAAPPINRYFAITTTDTATNSITSACSPLLTIDTELPIAPDTLTFSETSPTNVTGLNINWVQTTAVPDFQNYTVEFFNVPACAGTPTFTSSGIGATNLAVTGINNTTHSFRVIVFDLAGNQATSACSSDLVVDTSPPAIATNVEWDLSLIHI